jgi:hypothetical protein
MSSQTRTRVSGQNLGWGNAPGQRREARLEWVRAISRFEPVNGSIIAPRPDVPEEFVAYRLLAELFPAGTPVV